jgi:hypothetical protein
MSAVAGQDGHDIDLPVDDDDEDVVDYLDPEELDLDEPSKDEGDDTVHSATHGGAA